MDKPQVTVTISGPQKSGKSTFRRIINVWLEKHADYRVKRVKDRGNQDETVYLEDDFHILKIQTVQEESEVSCE